MNQDDTFRIILLLGLLVVLPIGVYHRLKSQATGEKLDRWQEGVFMLFTLRAAGVVGWLGIIAYLSIRHGWPGRRRPLQNCCGGRASSWWWLPAGLLFGTSAASART